MIDADLRDDLSRSFAAALASGDPVTARKAVLAAGWIDALEDDQAVAVAMMFRLQGSTRTDAGALDDVIAHQLLGPGRDDAGEIAVAIPVASGRRRQRGPSHVVLPTHADATRLIWIPDLGQGSPRIIDLDRHLGREPIRGVDGSFGLLGLAGEPLGATTALEVGPERQNAALAAGRLALAHQIVAGAHAALGLAVGYARARRQFDQPIGAFQAVKHRLSETLVAISAADASAIAASSASEPELVSSTIAKGLAGRAATIAAKNCLQVFGGIGFTIEHDLHHLIRRNLVLDRMLGDHRSLERDLGARLRSGELTGNRFVELDCMPRIEPLAPPVGSTDG